eukprot:TRINITY_DN60392_c0_g1_i1.p1 TRINITY_DN60392_c0_g1~~TRINITY_DN60392_c0_g1_i1.p1  ORF type:complete len:374 (+),score=104.84 TRINITY_DN60392_c0_g1_i1:87-1124(+)
MAAVPGAAGGHLLLGCCIGMLVGAAAGWGLATMHQHRSALGGAQLPGGLAGLSGLSGLGMPRLRAAPAGAGAGGQGEANASVRELALPPGTRRVLINIGSHVDPPIPPEDELDLAVLAVEPVLQTAVAITAHPRRLVLAAAISGGPPGVAVMHVLGRDGKQKEQTWSSSLSKPAEGADWTGPQRLPQPTVVIPLSTLLEAVPSTVTIPLLKLDMQGHDFAAVQSAGPLLRQRCPCLWTETYKGDPEQTSYVGVRNHVTLDWLPFMTQAGYKVLYAPDLTKDVRAENGTDGPPGEADVIWARVGEDETECARIVRKFPQTLEWWFLQRRQERMAIVMPRKIRRRRR